MIPYLTKVTYVEKNNGVEVLTIRKYTKLSGMPPVSEKKEECIPETEQPGKYHALLKKIESVLQ